MRGSKNPGALWPLWDVLPDGTIVSSYGSYHAGYALTGLDSYHMPEERLFDIARHLYSDARVELAEETLLQYVLHVHSDYSDRFREMEAAPRPDDAVRARQRELRLRMLKETKLRRFSPYVFVGRREGIRRREFERFGREVHEQKLKTLTDTERRVCAMLNRTGCLCDRLDGGQIRDLSYRWLHPGRSLRDEEASFLAGLSDRGSSVSPREALIRDPVEWSEDWVRIGGTYFGVLVLKELPEQTRFTLPELWLTPQLDFDFRVVTHVYSPPQTKELEKARTLKRFMHADAHRNPYVQDDARTGKISEAAALNELLGRTRQGLVHAGVQIVVSAESPAVLRDRMEKLQEISTAGPTGPFLFVEETGRHDRELFKTLPGASLGFDRYRVVTSNVACDLMTVCGGSEGDRSPLLPLLTERGELFGFTPFEQMRDNWNACVFGASGAGKSVIANLLIASCFLEGRLFVVDFAGPEKSSYLQVAELFGGQYIPVLGKGDVAINPFPPMSQALDGDKQTWASTLNFLTVFLSTLLSVREETREDQLVKALIQSGVIATYQRLRPSGRTPLLSDLLETWREELSRPGLEERERIRVREMMQLLDRVIRGPQGPLFNRPSSLTVDAQFAIFDLFGVDALPEASKQALVFLVTYYIKSLAFDDQDAGWKTIVLDEVAQLLRQPGMKDVVQELYATARKHRTSVWTVTQKYQDYKLSGVAATITQNSTTQMFLSHGTASGDVRRQIVEDFELDGREQHHFASLQTVKGAFSEALIRTEVCRGMDKRAVSTKVRVTLSPFDYQLATSDALDRAIQKALRKQFPNEGLATLLERLGYQTDLRELRRRMAAHLSRRSAA